MDDPLALVATGFGLASALALLLQGARMRRLASAEGVSLTFLAVGMAGYAVWLAYGLTTADVPLVVVDAVGAAAAGWTLTVALRLRRGRGRREPPAGAAAPGAAAGWPLRARSRPRGAPGPVRAAAGARPARTRRARVRTTRVVGPGAWSRTRVRRPAPIAAEACPVRAR